MLRYCQRGKYAETDIRHSIDPRHYVKLMKLKRNISQEIFCGFLVILPLILLTFLSAFIPPVVVVGFIFILVIGFQLT